MKNQYIFLLFQAHRSTAYSTQTGAVSFISVSENASCTLSVILEEYSLIAQWPEKILVAFCSEVSLYMNPYQNSFSFMYALLNSSSHAYSHLSAERFH